MTKFGGVDVVPLQGANFCFISSSYIQGHQFNPDTEEKKNELCLELLEDVTLFFTLTTQKLVLAIWGLCWYYFFRGKVLTLGFAIYPTTKKPRISRISRHDITIFQQLGNCCCCDRIFYLELLITGWGW